MRLARVVVVLAACSGDGDGGSTVVEPLEDWACLHVAEGTILDSATTREDAPEVTVGRTPYRVNIVQAETNYVRFQVAQAGSYTLLADAVDAIPAVWEGETRLELDAATASAECEADIPEVRKVDLAAGEHWVELGPIFQGAVWIVVGQ